MVFSSYFQKSLPIFLAVIVLSGCTTSRLEDAVPEAALVQDKVVEPLDDEANIDALTAETATEGAVNTGQFPNLNTSPGGATAQMTDTERDSYLAELRAAKAAQGGAEGAASSTSAAELRHIAESHDKEALEEIEGE